MKHSLSGAMVLCFMAAFPAANLYAADAKPGTYTCVGLYSETSEGYISARVAGKGEWVPVKVGDVLAANAEIKINVDRDWIELVPIDKPNTVYEIIGPQSGGEVLLKIADVKKGKSRSVSFPKGSADKPDGKYKDKLVVTQYLGRQIYMAPDGTSMDIKYGDVLDPKAKVKIIAINNTITLMNAQGGTAKVIGPLNFLVGDVLANKNLYKYLNVQK
jgi:hypothetical protein